MNTFPKECIACGRDALAIPEAPALAVIINIKTKERVGICADCAIVVLATLRPAIIEGIAETERALKELGS